MHSSAIMRQTWSYSYYADLTCSIYVKSEAKGLLKKKEVDALIYLKVIVPLWWLCAESAFCPRVGSRSPQSLKGNQVKFLNSPAAVSLAKQAS